MTWTIYRHWKGQHYLGLGTALHSETEEPHAVYRCLYDNVGSQTWVRPLAMFEESRDDGQPRFAPFVRMRTVQPEENQTVLAFGADAWADGRDLDAFVAGYDDNPNHCRGTRYLLETFDGAVLCNLNTLRLRRGLMGIASVATAPAHRRRGWASLLLRAVMELQRFLEGGRLRFLLFSEVDPSFYRTFGFRELPESQQHFLPSVAMATGANPLSDDEAPFVTRYF